MLPQHSGLPFSNFILTKLWRSKMVPTKPKNNTWKLAQEMRSFYIPNFLSHLFINCRYVNSHHLNKLDQEPNLEYLGHPLDAYHFVRHVASNWERLRSEPLFMNITLRNSSHFKEDIGKTLFVKWPDLFKIEKYIKKRNSIQKPWWTVNKRCCQPNVMLKEAPLE